MAQIAVDAQVTMQFAFTYADEYVDPDTLTGEYFLLDETTNTYPATPYATFVPTRVGVGLYEYKWVTPEVGRFKFVITGGFVDSDDIVYNKYYMVGNLQPKKTLDDTYVITMLGELDPLYVDPEYIMSLYPGGDIVEITEIIYRKSIDLESIVGEPNLEPLTVMQYDYVVAATMCELSRIYGLVNGGLGGFESTDSFQLGDLKVEKGGASGRLPAGKIDLGNANTWCELAAFLKGQLATTMGGTFHPVVAGSAYCDRIIPSRHLKSPDTSSPNVYWPSSRWDQY